MHENLAVVKKKIKEWSVHTVRYYYTLTRMAKIKNTDNTKCWCGAMGTLTHIWWECKTV